MSGSERSLQERLLALGILGLFVVVALGAAPFVALAFPGAELTVEAGPSPLPAVWAAVQLYVVLCVSVVLPAVLLWPLLRSRGGAPTACGLGWSRGRREAAGWLAGSAGGAGLILVLGAVLVLFGLHETSPGAPDALLLGPVLLALAFAALYEELLFRGLGFWAMERTANAAVALLLTSVLFGLAHANNAGANPAGLLNTVLAGLLLGALRLRSGSLWTAWGVHFGWNAALGVLLGARTSGHAFVGRLLETAPTEAGRATPILGGGDYGPEGSLLLTPLLVAWLSWLWLRRRPAPASAGAPPVGQTADRESGKGEPGSRGPSSPDR